MPTLDLFTYYRNQLAAWPMAAANFHALTGVETRALPGDGFRYTLQHNPARVRSTAAATDSASIASRPCFLCAANRPAEQHPLPIPGMDYEILVNPFPIFPYHFTIPAFSHTPQLISADNCARFTDLLRIAAMLPAMALFYNGPRCGASAPDHFHFQALPLQSLPLLTTIHPLPFLTYGAQFTSIDEAADWFRAILPHLASLEKTPTEESSPLDLEPRINLYAFFAEGVWNVLVIPRRAHRPSFYGTGEGQFLISPASVDLAGTIILPSASDFARFTADDLARLLSETTYPA